MGDEDALDSAVLGRLALTLQARSSQFIAPDFIDDSFVAQVQSILAEARGLVCSGTRSVAAVSVEYGTPEELAAEGALRASQNQHPAEALMAAEVLFDVAVPPFVDWAAPADIDEAIRVVRCLHHAIWRRFPPGAIAYTEGLRQSLSTAHLDSRLRLSQQLHDRVAHNIAAGLQRVELLAMEANGLGDEAATQLATLETLFRAALTDVQDMAVDLRARVGDESLVDAVTTYVADSSDLPPAARVSSQGESFELVPSAKEEILTIVQEALNNARRHALGATSVEVRFLWEVGFLTVEISDDGCGFVPLGVRSGALGLRVMAERAASIGGTVDILSDPAAGTAVRLTLPRDAGAAG